MALLTLPRLGIPILLSVAGVVGDRIIASAPFNRVLAKSLQCGEEAFSVRLQFEVVPHVLWLSVGEKCKLYMPFEYPFYGTIHAEDPRQSCVFVNGSADPK